MNKPTLVRALVSLLEQEIARATQAAQRTREGAVHEEARPENDKDTRALEASYLARGQAQRVVDLEQESKLIAFMSVPDFGSNDAIDLGAVVELESDETTKWYFLAPAAGGRSLVHEGIAIDVITPQAPLGRALIGRMRGDDLELRVAGRMRELTIVDVR
ncbi:MAG TPA: GreA/GreB family elongation factor [Polyangiales bacterium]|nr:GreA/GreB family elongation factor [Polyangiales bacterium]